jgi:hypothetical protein
MSCSCKVLLNTSETNCGLISQIQNTEKNKKLKEVNAARKKGRSEIEKVKESVIERA